MVCWPITQLRLKLPKIQLPNKRLELIIQAQISKRKKLEKIMSLFLKQSSITNDDVQKLVYVSDATATRYLQQLEQEGKIKKENAGKYLSYSRM
jgi:Fic family protein